MLVALLRPRTWRRAASRCVAVRLRNKADSPRKPHPVKSATLNPKNPERQASTSASTILLALVRGIVVLSWSHAGAGVRSWGLITRPGQNEEAIAFSESEDDMPRLFAGIIPACSLLGSPTLSRSRQPCQLWMEP